MPSSGQKYQVRIVKEALILLVIYFLFLNAGVITVREFIFDWFSFGVFDRSPVVNMI